MEKIKARNIQIVIIGILIITSSSYGGWVMVWSSAYAWHWNRCRSRQRFFIL